MLISMILLVKSLTAILLLYQQLVKISRLP